MAVAPRAPAIASILCDYGSGTPIFDTTAARAAGIGAPAVTRYFGRILSFALSDDFGRARDARPNAIREDLTKRGEATASGSTFRQGDGIAEGSQHLGATAGEAVGGDGMQVVSVQIAI